MAFLPLLALIALPVALRPPAAATGDASPEETLVIITPNNESIRYEFARAFTAYYQETTGRNLAIEWRMPGGTSDIVRYVDDRFLGNFRRHWESDPARGPWTRTVAESFNNPKVAPAAPDTDPLAAKARQVFLDSDVGIDVDLFFGGGQYDHNKQAQKGHAVDAGMLRRHPDWFTDATIPQTFSGEVFYDPQGRYYGTCLSSFGMCYNHDSLKLLPGVPPPRRWADLGRPEFFGAVAVADPTKSGSINKCFEMLIQQQMAEAIRRAGGKTPAALDEGWAAGFNLIQRIGANSRYITDSASKVPRDVAKGETAVGMCIDFYGRTEAEWAEAQSGGTPRLTYVAPIGGSSISADPILMFRGAPNRAAAVAFIEFVLSKRGQRLWNSRPGTPGGPEKYALRRLPVRKDMYTPEERRQMSDAEAEPFAPEEEFTYDPSLTARHFSLIRTLIKTMIIDPLPELQAAWTAILAAGGPEACPEAMAELHKLPFPYAEADAAAAALNPYAAGNTPLSCLVRQREWSEFFRQQYLRAAEAAKQ
jgi:ABC-type Fe3+ transport system substrate-binding protein